MPGKVLNWTTEAKLAKMRAAGCAEVWRKEIDGRIVILLANHAEGWETCRSLPLVEPRLAPLTLF